MVDIKLTGDFESFLPERRKAARLSVLTTSLQYCIESPNQGSKAKRSKNCNDWKNRNKTLYS